MGDAITRNAGVTASERHRFLAQVPAPRRRVLHFGKCACKRQLVLSLTSAGLGEQKANQAVRGVARKLRLPSLVLIPVALALADHE
jgi:hypothetical protein